MNWIDCNERLPEGGVDCLVICEGDVVIAHYWELTKKWVAGCVRAKDGGLVTHWMPLPDQQTGYTLSEEERDAIGAEYLEMVAKRVPVWGMYNWLNEQAAKLRGGE